MRIDVFTLPSNSGGSDLWLQSESTRLLNITKSWCTKWSQTGVQIPALLFLKDVLWPLHVSRLDQTTRCTELSIKSNLYISFSYWECLSLSLSLSLCVCACLCVFTQVCINSQLTVLSHHCLSDYFTWRPIGHVFSLMYSQQQNRQ